MHTVSDVMIYNKHKMQSCLKIVRGNGWSDCSMQINQATSAIQGHPYCQGMPCISMKCKRQGSLQSFIDIACNGQRCATASIVTRIFSCGHPPLQAQMQTVKHRLHVQECHVTWISRSTTENSYANAILPRPASTAHVLDAGASVRPAIDPVMWPFSAAAHAKLDIDNSINNIKTTNFVHALCVNPDAALQDLWYPPAGVPVHAWIQSGPVVMVCRLELLCPEAAAPCSRSLTCHYIVVFFLMNTNQCEILINRLTHCWCHVCACDFWATHLTSCQLQVQNQCCNK